jgi:UDP-N-acetylmuramoylalanine--D-glutamate ligase
VAVVNADDPAVVGASRAITDGVKVVSFSVDAEADYSVGGGLLRGPGGAGLLACRDLPRSFPHDVANSLAAAAVAFAAGANAAGVTDGLRSPPVLQHRLELVAESDGIRWYDDSKATTPASVVAAARGFDSVVLIAGGRNKGLALTPLASTAPPVRWVIAIGEAADEVAGAFRGRVPVETATSMEAAVSAAAQIARSGDAVLLSPGCASFDWYPSYAARGEHFASLVRARLKGVDG